MGEVEDALDDALSWRRVELQALRAAIAHAERTAPGSPLARALARSGVTMLYAHWEGFVKEACQAYVDFVARRRLRLDELNEDLVRTVLLSLGKRAVAGDESSTLALIEAVLEPAKARARIPKNTIVDTKSNLRYAVLAEIMSSIGFPVTSFATRDKLIDRTLCDGRNTIAHGRNLYPAVGSFDDLHAEVMEMIEDVRDLILAAVRQGSYRRPLAQQAIGPG
jgi:hypothetical protein